VVGDTLEVLSFRIFSLAHTFIKTRRMEMRHLAVFPRQTTLWLMRSLGELAMVVAVDSLADGPGAIEAGAGVFRFPQPLLYQAKVSQHRGGLGMVRAVDRLADLQATLEAGAGRAPVPPAAAGRYLA